MAYLTTKEIAPKLCESLGISLKQLVKMKIVFHSGGPVEIRCAYFIDAKDGEKLVESFKTYQLVETPDA